MTQWLVNQRGVNVRVHRATSTPSGNNPRKPTVQRIPWSTIIMKRLCSESSPPADVGGGAVALLAMGSVRSRVNVPLSRCWMSGAEGDALSGGVPPKAQMTAWEEVAATEGTVYTKDGFGFEDAN